MDICIERGSVTAPRLFAGEFPWESAAQTRQRLSQQSITRRPIEADRRPPRA
jgi:hypothetical protein